MRQEHAPEDQASTDPLYVRKVLDREIGWIYSCMFSHNSFPEYKAYAHKVVTPSVIGVSAASLEESMG